MRNLKAFTASLVFMLIFATVSLQAAPKTRVKFPRGKSSTTIAGRIAQTQTECFVLGTRGGQSLYSKLTSPTKKVIFTEINGPLASNSEFIKNETTSGGDFDLCIKNRGSATTFSLFISID